MAGMCIKMSEERRNRIIKMLKDNKDVKEIGDKCGASYRTVHRIMEEEQIYPELEPTNGKKLPQDIINKIDYLHKRYGKPKRGEEDEVKKAKNN